MHLYSSPLTHHRPPPAANYGRPDVHALFQLWLSLTEVNYAHPIMNALTDHQLTWLQAIEMSTTLRRNQIVPTGVCGLMGLTHFVYALSTSPLRVPSFTFLTHLVSYRQNHSHSLFPLASRWIFVHFTTVSLCPPDVLPYGIYGVPGLSPASTPSSTQRSSFRSELCSRTNS